MDSKDAINRLKNKQFNGDLTRVFASSRDEVNKTFSTGKHELVLLSAGCYDSWFTNS